MRSKLIVLSFFFLFIAGMVTAQNQQKITIDVVEQPLNKILLDLRDRYNFRLSYDEDYTSNYIITLKREFNSKEKALKALLDGLPIRFEEAGDVFMIIPERKAIQKIEKSQPQKLIGQILDKRTYETLPFSHVLINGKQLISDQQGQFTYITSDSSFTLKISHLGYYIYDTVFTEGLNHQFLLNSSTEELGEVLVKRYQIEKSTMVGEKSGKMKLNHVIAPYLPGYGDNTVYSILRLMPGVLAAGEQSSDLLIWGSYEGQTKVQLDGFTLFGLKNFNDNIGAVNPLVVKNIEISKGGYDSKYGDRIGGMVHIIGKDGQRPKPAITLSVNNSTINSFVEIPFLKKSSITAAFRTTYYELYDPAKLNILGTTRGNSGKVVNIQNNNGSGKGNGKGKGTGQSVETEQNQNISTKDTLIDLNAFPDYSFLDVNFKYSYRGDDGSLFYVSLYGGGDNFLYSIEGDYNNSRLKREEKETNIQKGASAYWGKRWRKGYLSNFILSYSKLNNSTTEFNNFTDVLTGNNKEQKQINVENDIDEYAFRSENTISLINGHNLEFGGGYVLNNIILNRQTNSEVLINMNSKSERIYSYVHNNMPLGNHIDLKAGIRMNYSINLSKVYFEPRLSASFRFEDNWRLNASWGKYSQFISKTAVVDSAVNHSFFWAAVDNVNIPVMNSDHLVGGLSYIKNNLTVSIESYYKTLNGVPRYVSGTNQVAEGFYKGNARSYGLDFYFRKAYKNNLIWFAYTLSKTEEQFSYNPFNIYRPAMHDQRHELKVAGILNIKSFYLSANYVYGSGFEKTATILNDGSSYLPFYSRLDAAIIYRFAPKKMNLEAGVSVLNVLNRENIKYSNLKRVQAEDKSFISIYSEAVPFSPMLFLKMKF